MPESVFLISIITFLCLISFLFFRISPAKRLGEGKESVLYFGTFFLLVGVALLCLVLMPIRALGLPLANSLFILSVHALLHGLKLREESLQSLYKHPIVLFNILLAFFISWFSIYKGGAWEVVRVVFMCFNVSLLYFACYLLIRKQRGVEYYSRLVEMPFLFVSVINLLLWLPFYFAGDYEFHIRVFFAVVIITIFATFGGLLSLLLSDVIGFYYRTSITDGLTGLFNRRHFTSAGQDLLENSGRYGYPVSCLMCDIDDFKSVNDSFGHDTGDKVIVAFAEGLEKNIRTGDILARIGGEEFAILLDHAHLDTAMEVAERMRQYTEGLQLDCNGRALSFSASFGVAQITSSSLEKLIKAADEALYHSKHSGKNTVTRYTDRMEPPEGGHS